MGLTDVIYTFLIMFVMIGLAIGFVFLAIDFSIFTDEEKCLEKVAKEVCEERGMLFYDYDELSNDFWCKDDLRFKQGIEFNFLPEERGECKESGE